MLLKLFVVILFLRAISSKIAAITESYNNSVTGCVDIILKNIFSEHIYQSRILHFGKESFFTSLPTSRIGSISKIKNFSKDVFRAYILSETLADTQTLLNKLFEHRLLLPTSWYIYFSNFSNINSFSFFTNYYITNVFAIDTNFDIFTIDPYKYENVNNPENKPFKIGSCNDINKIVFKKHFFKYPEKWRNTTVYEYFRILEPFTTTSHDGLEDKLFDLFKERLDFKNHRRNVTRENDTARLLENEQISKKTLREHKIDIFGGLLSLRTQDSPGDYDITPAYLYKTIVWMSPNGASISEWWRIKHIFSSNFYLSWILILFILSVLTKFFFKTSINAILVVALKILLEYPVIHQLRLKSLSSQISVGAWLLAMLTISALFKNYLVVIKSTSIRKHQLESLDDILQSNLKLAGVVNKYLKEIYSTRQAGVFKINFDEMETCVFHEECFNRTAFQKDTAVLIEKSRATYYYIPLWYRDENGDSIVHLSSEIVLSEAVEMIFSRGYPLFKSCADIILRSNANGWIRKQLDSLKRATDIKMVQMDTRTKSVRLKSLSFIFIILVYGLISALFAFCAEVIGFAMFGRRAEKKILWM